MQCIAKNIFHLAFFFLASEKMKKMIEMQTNRVRPWALKYTKKSLTQQSQSPTNAENINSRKSSDRAEPILINDMKRKALFCLSMHIIIVAAIMRASHTLANSIAVFQFYFSMAAYDSVIIRSSIHRWEQCRSQPFCCFSSWMWGE